MSTMTTQETISTTFGSDASNLPARGTSLSTLALRCERWLHIAFLGGLAGVFLVNALVAVLQPDDFTRLVEQSAMGRWFHVDPGSWLGPVIGVNDLLLGLAVLAAIRFRRTMPVVLAWAGVWLLAVMLIKVTSLQAFPV